MTAPSLAKSTLLVQPTSFIISKCLGPRLQTTARLQISVIASAGFKTYPMRVDMMLFPSDRVAEIVQNLLFACENCHRYRVQVQAHLQRSSRPNARPYRTPRELPKRFRSPDKASDFNLDPKNRFATVRAFSWSASSPLQSTVQDADDNSPQGRRILSRISPFGHLSRAPKRG